MIDHVQCRKCKICVGKDCQVWLMWFRKKWNAITTWYKGELIEDLKGEK